jgi:outer membrane protein OmpA-like peptidoglycan-associated protein
VGLFPALIILIPVLSLTSLVCAEDIDTTLSDIDIDIATESTVDVDSLGINTGLSKDEQLTSDYKPSMETITEVERKASQASEIEKVIEQHCFSQLENELFIDKQSFSICANGHLIYDNLTGLMWTRCSIGKTWNAQTKECEGQASTHNWKESLNEVVSVNQSGFSAYNDWRLPNIKELASIADLSCVNPAINATYFPNTDNEGFWTSSVFEQYPGRAWYVNFNLGNDYAADKRYFKQLRLVRLGAGSSSYNLLNNTQSTLDDACASFATIKFTEIIDVPLTSTVNSEQVVVDFPGKNRSCAVRIKDGEYEINSNGIWSTTDGTIKSGDSLSVRHVSSDKYLTNVITHLSVCNVSAIFRSTTIELVVPYEDIALDAEILFDYKSFKLTEKAKSSIANYVEQYRNRFEQISEIMVIGHTDGIGSQNYNQKLSEQRAQSVASYIETIDGIPDSDIEAIGKGKLEPIASNDTEEGRSKNRRVVMRIVFK